MIPLRLQEGLKKRLESLFDKKQYPRPSKNTEDLSKNYASKMNIYSQNLPIKEQADEVFAPFTLIKLNDGGQASSNAKHVVHVSILVGMYDESATTGFRDVSLALTTIMDELKNRPNVEGMYELDLDAPIDWELSEEETYPYFFGGLSVHFKTPIIEFGGRKDVEGLI